QMGEIKKSLAAEAATEKAAPPAAQAQAAAAPAAPAEKPAATPAPATQEAAPVAQHTMTVKLKPGQGAEIKVTMRKDATLRYEWTTEGGPVNYDTHGDPVNAPKNFYHGYGKGRNTASDSGTLKAAFDGTHGWFWRNRTNSEVTVTLKTSGDYQQIKRVL
ncbi:MAG: transmembrane anchor protein, partial [Burkholderiales bacterium]|nr:transmembrane anchor protein [Burkholderiales bacterium]